MKLVIRLFAALALVIAASAAMACSPYRPVLFFGAESIAVEGTNLRVLEQFLASYGPTKFPSECRYILGIVAHVDSAELVKLGPGFDLKRGQAIRDAAIALGWPLDRVEIAVDGTNRPFIPTPPNTSEPQN